MKNEILKILSVYAGHMFQDNFFDGDTLYLIGERQETIEQLLQLMCYREVRAFKLAYPVPPLDIPGLILRAFKGDYPEQTILNAIEQVKNEMK